MKFLKQFWEKTKVFALVVFRGIEQAQMRRAMWHVRNRNFIEWKPTKEITMFKAFPELEYYTTKSTNLMVDTIEFQGIMFTKSLEYFNKITDRMFYTYTERAAETVNAATEYAKENIKDTKITKLFGSGK